MRKPGLVIATAIGVAILFALGWWQKERLEWKRGIIAETEAASTAPPFTSLREVQRALDAGEPVDFRRVALPAEAIADAPVFRVYRPSSGAIRWELFTPVRSGTGTVFAGLGTVADGEVPDGVDVPERLLGHIRLNRGRLRGELSPNPEANRYYSFDPDGLWSEAVPEADTRVWLDADSGYTDADSIPVRVPELSNRHFEYMLTWWSFALVLLVISATLYRRE